MKLFLILSTFIAAAYASCPSSCSGNGKCGEFDKCICFDRWIGNDCSVRQCPYGLSWVAAKKGSTDIVPAGGDLKGNHAYSVCSSRGLCGEAGECECFEGYTGRACTRTTCPNSCSGKGRCLFNNEEEYGVKDYVQFGSQAWDAGKTRQCVCDRGYGGVDCSSRLCPTGDDPLTKCDAAGLSDSDDTQVITITRATCLATDDTDAAHVLTCADVTDLKDTDACTAASVCTYDATPTCKEYFTLTFTDMFNGQYTTRPIGMRTDWTTTWVNRNKIATDMKEAMKELPNFAVPDVKITTAFGGTCLATDDTDAAHVLTCADVTGADLDDTDACTAASVCTYAADTKVGITAFDVTFLHPANAGQQTLLEFQAVGGSSAASQPRFAQTDCTVVAVTSEALVPSTLKHKENDSCSNRGSCDTESGLCSCFEGYTGEACSSQTVFF